MRNILMEKEPVQDGSFASAVRDRYNRDEVIRIGIVLMLILIPVTIDVVFTLIPTGMFGGTVLMKITTYAEEWETISDLCIGIIIVTIICRMYTRLYDHSVRDIQWRRSLIEYVRSRGGDVSELEAVDDEIRKSEEYRFHTIPSVLKFATIVVAFYCLMLVSTSGAMYDADSPFVMKFFKDIGLVDEYATTAEEAEWIANLFINILVVSTIAFCARKIIVMPFRHEFMQCRFTRTMSKSLSYAGIFIPPMTNVVREVPWKKHIILTVATLGLYLVFLFFSVIRSGNNHIMNQWAYEDELAKAVASDGGEGFGKEYFGRSDLEELDISVRSITAETVNAVIETEEFVKTTLRTARRTGGMPAYLIIGELFILTMCAAYILRSIGTGSEMYLSPAMYEITPDNIRRFTPAVWAKEIMIAFNLFFMSNAIGTLIGIASRRPSSWRNMVRSCFSFMIPTWINAYALKASGLSHLFDFNPVVTTAVLYDVLLMLILSVRIKRFYYPPDEEIPPVTRWIRYALIGCLTRPWRGFKTEYGLGDREA